MFDPNRRPEKKLRGISRRMRSLRKWGLQFKEKFPSEKELKDSGLYWNWKLPTHQAMVEGKHSTQPMKQEVAQILISACTNLVKAKPTWARHYRVTCVICMPDMFSSEICIYLNEGYFRSKVDVGTQSNGVCLKRIEGRSLASDWGLALPRGISEIGTQIDFSGYEGGINAYQGERWMYGEIDG